MFGRYDRNIRDAWLPTLGMILVVLTILGAAQWESKLDREEAQVARKSCLENGGSFTSKSNNSWSCTETASPTTRGE